jgi:hypothetical protein
MLANEISATTEVCYPMPSVRRCRLAVLADAPLREQLMRPKLRDGNGEGCNCISLEGRCSLTSGSTVADAVTWLPRRLDLHTFLRCSSLQSLPRSRQTKHSSLQVFKLLGIKPQRLLPVVVDTQNYAGTLVLTLTTDSYMMNPGDYIHMTRAL